MTAAAALKEGDRREGGREMKGGRMEARNEALTTLVQIKESNFYFKHLLNPMVATDATSQLLMSELKAVDNLI